MRGLTKRFGRTVAVDDLSFIVRRGLVTAFLGPNGAGKTTTLRVILGLAKPSEGIATILGRPYRLLDAPRGASARSSRSRGSTRGTRPETTWVVFGAVVATAATVVAVAWLAVSDEPVPFGWRVLLTLLLTPPATGLVASIGVVVGAAVKNQLAAILAALGWALVVESLISAIVPWAAKWLPYSGGPGALAGTGASGDLLAPWAGGLLLVEYVVAFGAVGVWIVAHQDV